MATSSHGNCVDVYFNPKTGMVEDTKAGEFDTGRLERRSQ